MMNMLFERKLTIPMEVKEMYPLTSELQRIVALRAEEIKNIITGKDKRLLLVIGPCSADWEDSVLAYIYRLRSIQQKVIDKVYIVPRLYTKKPRSSANAYKGLMHQPDPTAKPDMFKGIIAMRELHMRVLKETGFTCADEMLYPENHKYLDDLIAYVAIGARSVEDQHHKLTASDVDIPVGMKNPMGGNLASLIGALQTAQSPHSFIYRGWEVHSFGNPLAHAVLRGYVDINGRHHANYRYEDLQTMCALYAGSGLLNPAVIVDTNHSNSGKDPFRQSDIVKDVMNSRNRSSGIGNLIKGFMVESYLEDGSQPPGGSVFGRSITDACIGWEKTEQLILSLADKA